MYKKLSLLKRDEEDATEGVRMKTQAKVSNSSVFNSSG